MPESTRRGLAGFFPIFGLAGSALVCLAILVVGLTYQGQASERFSLLNHFISELGQRGVSRDAWLFNTTLVASGILFVPFCAGLGMALRGWWGYLGLACGALAGLSLAGVGLFPMNDLAPHVVAATWFFRFGMATTLLYGIGMLRQKRETTTVPRSASAFSLLAFSAYALFLVMASIPGVGGGDPLDPATLLHRPGFWLLAVLEWAVFFATVIWFLGVSLLLMVGGGRWGRAGPGRNGGRVRQAVREVSAGRGM